MEKENYKELDNENLLYLEHDTQVDLLDLLPGRDCTSAEYLEFSSYYKEIEAEIKSRGLEKLPRLNGFN